MSLFYLVYQGKVYFKDILSEVVALMRVKSFLVLKFKTKPRLDLEQIFINPGFTFSIKSILMSVRKTESIMEPSSPWTYTVM